MIIRVKTKTEIIWLVVVIYILKTYILDSEKFFLFSVGLIILYSISKDTMVLPKIPGVWPYIFGLIFVSVLGIAKYSRVLVERDIFYEFSAVVWIVLGYYIYDLYKDKGKSLWKTLCLLVGISSLICVFQGFASLQEGLEFNAFRENFSQGIRGVSIMMPLLLGRRYVLREKTFHNWLELFIMALWTVQILLNLSRVSIINVALGMIIFIFCEAYRSKISLIGSLKLLTMIVLIIGLGMGVVSMLPDDSTERFAEKFSNTFQEIDSDNEYTKLDEAQSDWRGYEISCAQEQWKKSDLMTKVIGGGNGTLIKIHYIPDQWKETVESQNGMTGVTVLHNTYYTLLIKGGMLLVGLFIYFMLRNIISGWKAVTDSSNKYILEGIFLVILFCIIIIDAYVIRSMIQKGEDIAPFLLIGWINAKMAIGESC